MTTGGRFGQMIERDIDFLTSDDCAGRAPGTAGGRRARRHIVTRLGDLGVGPAGVDGFEQRIPAIGGANVLGTIPGSGILADRYVVLAAHYDHLGVINGEVFRGAEDNASGVAVLLETVRRLALEAGGLGRSVLVCAFDAEEPPYFLTRDMGSIGFVSDPTVPLERIDQMVCLDIVGRRLGGTAVPDPVGESVFVLGGERSPAGSIVDAVETATPGVTLRRADADLIPPLSDYFAFEQAGIPFLFFTCGRSPVYHTPADTSDRLDLRKMTALAHLLTGLIIELSTTRGVGGYRAGARNDRATLRSLAMMLEPLAGVDPEADAALDLVEEGLSLLDGDRLPEDARTQLPALVLALEAHLGESEPAAPQSDWL